MKKKGKGIMIAALLVAILALTGEVKCIIKACNCNWEPIGKAEIFYTAAAVTPFGCIMGWISIEDK